MNILVLSWRDPKHSLAGGAEQVMHEHMKGWIAAGNNVTLFASKPRNLPSVENLNGVKIVRSGYQYLGVQINAFFYYMLNKNKIDFVIDQFHGIPFFTPFYVSKSKLAVLQEVTKEVWFKNPLPFPINIAVAFIGYVLEPFIFLFYKRTKFMVGSNSAKTDLVTFGIKDENVTVIPHGVIAPRVNILDTNINKKQNNKIITFLGTLSSDKGILDAILTFKILNKNGSYKFFVIGKPETQSYFEKIKLKSKGIDIKFWGRVSNEQKFKLLADSFVLVNPSIREGWGLVNIEANIVGTPVVAYPSQGLVDSVKNGFSGIITKNRTPSDLAYEIEMLSKNKDLYQELSSNAKIWSSNFKWSNSVKISQDLIHKICK